MDNNNSKLSSYKAFILGVVFSLLLVFSVGFFVLLFSTSDGMKLPIAEREKVEKFDEANARGFGGGGQDDEISIRPVTKADHIRGDLDKAEVVLVEYSDMECPFCKRFHFTLKQIKEEYGDKFAWVYRHFPLDNLHPKARLEAQASECAAELGGNDAFWRFLDRIYEITPSNNRLDLEKLPEIAAEIGLDVGKFNECLSSNKFADKVQADYEDAIASGGSGTPYSILLSRGGEKIPVRGAVPAGQLRSLIDSLIKTE